MKSWLRSTVTGNWELKPKNVIIKKLRWNWAQRLKSRDIVSKHRIRSSGSPVCIRFSLVLDYINQLLEYPRFLTTFALLSKLFDSDPKYEYNIFFGYISQFFTRYHTFWKIAKAPSDTIIYHSDSKGST